MNGLCAPPMLMTTGPENIKQPLPNTQGHSPIAPTSEWKGANDPSLDSLNTLDDIAAQELRNDYSDAAVMDYVNLKAENNIE